MGKVNINFRSLTSRDDQVQADQETQQKDQSLNRIVQLYLL